MSRKPTRASGAVRGSARLARGLASAGALCVLVAFGLSVSWVERTFTADGWVPPLIAEGIERTQWGLLFAGAACLILAGAMSRRGWALASAAALSLGAGAAFANAFYPRHLLFQPKRLAAVALGQELLLRDFTPQPTLRVASHEVLRARYPAINIHAHFSYPGLDTVKSAEELVAVMDACNVAQAVDLDGGVEEALQQELDRYARKAPERLVVFAHIWFGEEFSGPAYFQKLVGSLDEAARSGAAGIKIWKNLGLQSRDKTGQVVPVDDLRLEPLWRKAAALKLPILIHVADPEPFFHPADARNERYEELANALTGVIFSFAHPRYPRPSRIYAQLERVLERHRDVPFIGAHMLVLGNDLETLGAMLDRHPNLYVDTAAMAHELGRQPRAARAFFLKYEDRILFGTDGNPDEVIYRQYFRFLETADEYFDYPGWPQYNPGRWKIYGLDLPDDVLRKVYRDNAARLLKRREPDPGRAQR